MQIEDWGEIPYRKALEKQLERVENVRLGTLEECLVFCSHPSVVTLGKKSKKEDLAGWAGDIVEVSRGGQATYHGPGQIVVYPIIDLKKRSGDVSRFLRGMERAIVASLASFGVKSHGQSEGHTGVWVKDEKIASIGVAIKRWVTYHGLALNLERDPLAFTGIRPCGFSAGVMTSVEKLLQKKIPREVFSAELKKYLINELEVPWERESKSP